MAVFISEGVRLGGDADMGVEKEDSRARRGAEREGREEDALSINPTVSSRLAH